MLQHYPDSVTINGNVIETSPFPDISFVNQHIWLGLSASNYPKPTEPASSARQFNAYAAGVLCQIPTLELLPRTYLAEHPSNYPHWNHVTRYVITPVAHLDLETFSSCVYEKVFLNIETQLNRVYRQLQSDADAQTARTIKVCQLPPPIERTAWIRSIENTTDELQGSDTETVPITANGKLFIPQPMNNQAETVSALESICRSDAGLVPVTCFYQRVDPGHQPVQSTMTMQFQTNPAGPDTLELVDLLTEDPKQTYTIEPMLHASGAYPDSFSIKLAPHADFTEDELTQVLYRCYRLDIAKSLNIAPRRVNPRGDHSKKLIAHMRDQARHLLANLPDSRNVVTVVKMVDFSHRPQSAKPLRRPNCSRRLHPGLSPRNTELIPVQANARVLPPTTA